MALLTAGRPTTRGALLPPRLAAALDTRGGALAIFVMRRVLWMIPVVFFVIVITFVLMHIAPERNAILNVIVPADDTRAATVENGDFGTSPIFG